MRNKLILTLASLTFFLNLQLFADDPTVSGRGLTWYFNDNNTSVSANPSSLQYFKYYDQLPPKITLPIIQKFDMTALKGKKLYVGYGVVDPTGSNCRTFPGSITEDGQSHTICLPWWRIEREYLVSGVDSAAQNFKSIVPIVYPPKTIRVCNQWAAFENEVGGQVTCTSFYSKNVSQAAGCYDNPNQAACFIDECSQQIKQTCTLNTVTQGANTDLTGAYTGALGSPSAATSMVNVTTYQYDCPSGYMPQQQCVSQQNVLEYPFQCKPPSPPEDRYGEYVYCNKNNPVMDSSGNVIGFTDKCSDGRQITCQVDSYSSSTKMCLQPVYQSSSIDSTQNQTLQRTYTDVSIDTSQQSDPYAANPLCLRLNDNNDATHYKSLPYAEGVHPSMGWGCGGGNIGGETLSPNYIARVDQGNISVGNAAGSNSTGYYLSFDGWNLKISANQDGSGGCGSDSTCTLYPGMGQINGASCGGHGVSCTESRSSNCNFDFWVENFSYGCDQSQYDVYDPSTNECQRYKPIFQYRCYSDFPAPKIPANCSVTSSVLTAPVTDFRNQTVNTEEDISYTCTSVSQKVVGCNQWGVSNSAGKLSYVPQVAYETKDFSNDFGTAMASATGINQSMHVFSGWAGNCEYGMFLDFNWLNDPTFWASTAMSLYTAGAQGYLGSTVATNLNSFTNSAGQTLYNATSAAGYNDVTGVGQSLLTSARTNATVASGTWSSWEASMQGLSNPGLTQAVQLAAIVAPASSQEKQQAYSNQMALMTQPTNNVQAAAYASCMASLGLDYSNIISYEVSATQTPDILFHPWDNPLRLGLDDYNGLQALLTSDTGDTTYLQNHYRVKEQDGFGVTLMASDMSSYLTLGNVVCAGYRVAGTMNQMNAQAVASAIKSGNSADATTAMLANGAIAAIGMANPLAGLAANVAFKMMSSFSTGDACTDSQFAMSRGSLEYKTEQFKTYNQCHYVDTDCSVKFGFGPFEKCLAHRDHFCCYDQIFSKVLAESIYGEMGYQWSDNGCNQIQITDLQNVGWSVCQGTQTPQANKCISQDEWAQLKSAIMAQMSKGVPVDSVKTQVQNAMTLPQ